MKLAILLPLAIKRIAISAFLVFSAGSVALAAGSDSSQPPAKTETTQKCTDGKIWDKKKKKCVAADQSYNDDDLYEAARELAYDGQYGHAIDILQLAKNQNDPRILNYLGFANRKAGRIELGMSYYQRALALDADYSLARSYMGQALVEQGDLKGASLQLEEIKMRNGEDNWPYRALKDSIEGGDTY